MLQDGCFRGNLYANDWVLPRQQLCQSCSLTEWPRQTRAGPWQSCSQPVLQVVASRALEPCRSFLMPSVWGIAGWGGDGLSLSWRSSVQAGTSYSEHSQVFGPILWPSSGEASGLHLQSWHFQCPCGEGAVGGRPNRWVPTVWTV